MQTPQYTFSKPRASRKQPGSAGGARIMALTSASHAQKQCVMPRIETCLSANCLATTVVIKIVYA